MRLVCRKEGVAFSLAKGKRMCFHHSRRWSHVRAYWASCASCAASCLQKCHASWKAVVSTDPSGFVMSRITSFVPVRKKPFIRATLSSTAPSVFADHIRHGMLSSLFDPRAFLTLDSHVRLSSCRIESAHQRPMQGRFISLLPITMYEKRRLMIEAPGNSRFFGLSFCGD